jgi:hypothetical protein
LTAASPTTEPVKPTTSPLSGRKGGYGKPVVVVKLDNTPSAQPHRGLAAADVVYVEPVEWGLTRLAAVYATSVPKVVGPVRSARVSDIEVFAPYGNVAFVYSGAQKRLQPKLYDANWTPVSPDLKSPGFHRESGRVAPFNLMAEPRRILSRVDDVAGAEDMGLVFTSRKVKGGSAARTVTARWPGTTIQFRWNREAGAYDVWMHGRPARDTGSPGVQRASTVVVQYVKEVDSGYGDKFGGRTPMTVTVGKGKGVVLRDGRAHKITWRRTKAGKPTRYLDAKGKPIAFDPGQVWIVLMDRSRRVEVG